MGRSQSIGFQIILVKLSNSIIFALLDKWKKLSKKITKYPKF